VNSFPGRDTIPVLYISPQKHKNQPYKIGHALSYVRGKKFKCIFALTDPSYFIFSSNYTIFKLYYI